MKSRRNSATVIKAELQTEAIQQRHDRLELIFDDDGAVGGGGLGDSGFAKHGGVGVVLGGCGGGETRGIDGVVRDGGGRVFELVAGEDADDSVAGGDHPLLTEQFGSGDAGGAGGFAAEAAGSDLGFGFQDQFVRDLTHDTVADFECSQALQQVDRAVDLDGSCERRGSAVVGVHLREEFVGDDFRCVEPAAVPTQLVLLEELIQRVRAGGIDDRQTRDAIDEAQLFQLGERLAERARVAEVPARHHDPIGDFPVQTFEHSEHDRLLAFQPERVHAVAQVNPARRADIADLLEGVIEVSLNLQRLRSVVERLRQLSERDLAAANEDDGVKQPRGAGVNRQRRAGVARRGTRRDLRSDHVRVRGGSRHAVVFEAARRIQPLVLQQEFSALKSRVLSNASRRLQNGLPLADRHDLLVLRERQQLAKPPHAAEVERIATTRPPRLKLLERPRHRYSVPVVGDVEQMPALGTIDECLADRIGRSAGGVHADLMRDVS